MSKLPVMSVCRHIAGPIYRLLFPATVYGLNNVHKLQGKAIVIASNHHSYHDPLQLIVRCNRDLHFLTKKELFQGPFGWFFNCLGLIKIDRQAHGQSLQPALNYLSDNQAIAIFPEGTTKHRQPDELLLFRYGAVRLASSSNAYIAPVAITGRPKLFRHAITIRFGKPYKIKPDADIAAENNKLQGKVIQLMKDNGVNAKAIQL